MLLKPSSSFPDLVLHSFSGPYTLELRPHPDPDRPRAVDHHIGPLEALAAFLEAGDLRPFVEGILDEQFGGEAVHVDAEGEVRHRIAPEAAGLRRRILTIADGREDQRPEVRRRRALVREHRLDMPLIVAAAEAELV